MASGESSEGAGGRAFLHWDFSEAYLNPKFSDCLIRLLPEGGASPEEEEGQKAEKLRPQPVDLPASIMLLSSQSAYFKTLLVGDFKESADGKKEVSISLDPADFDSFKDILFFYYYGHLPLPHDDASTRNSDVEPDRNCRGINSLIQVLRLADRFSFLSCLQLCVTKLNERASKFTAREAEAVVCLPEALLKLLILKPAVKAAKNVLIQEAASLLLQDVGDDPGPAFLRLPEPCILTMIDSDLLAVESEDLVGLSVWDWVEHRFPSPESQLAALKRVLPLIRFQFMNPRYVLRMVFRLSELVKRLEVEPWIKTASQKLMECAQKICKVATTGKAGAPDAVSTAVASQCLSIIAMADSVPGQGGADTQGEILLESLGECARIGYSPSTVAITLEIPQATAQEWSQDDPAVEESSNYSFSGGWVSVTVEFSVQMTVNLYFDGASPVTLHYKFWHNTPDDKMQLLLEGQECLSGGDGRGFDAFFVPCSQLLQEKDTYFPGGTMIIQAQVRVV